MEFSRSTRTRATPSPSKLNSVRSTDVEVDVISRRVGLPDDQGHQPTVIEQSRRLPE